MPHNFALLQTSRPSPLFPLPSCLAAAFWFAIPAGLPQTASMRSSPFRLRLFTILSASVVAAGGMSLIYAADAAKPAAKKPVVLYSRAFNAQGENRYSADGTFKDVLGQLARTFEVRVSDRPLDRSILQDVSVVVIANPSDKAVGTNPPPRHMLAVDILNLRQYVEKGGGLIVMGNQENHNLEIAHFNSLLGSFGLQFTNVYTDAKKLVIPKTAPIIGGLRWAYYTGNQVLVKPDHRAKARSLVANDLAQKPDKGPRDAAGSLLAVAEPGQGRVAVITDAGWLTNDALSGKGIGEVAIKDHDNLEIMRRLLNWAAHAVQ